MRLAAAIAGIVLFVAATFTPVALGLSAMSDPAGGGPAIVVVNDTSRTWQVLACTSGPYPDRAILQPGERWAPEGFPTQDDPGAGCWLAARDTAGGLDNGACLAVPETSQRTVLVSRAVPSSLAECMDRSDPRL